MIVYTSGSGRSASGLAAGMRWSVLGNVGDGDRKQGAAVRKQASFLASDAYTTFTAGNTVYLGQYNQPALKKTTVKAKHSLALVFLQALLAGGSDPETINAILLVEPQGLPEKRALVIIEGGRVARDVVENTREAVDLATKAREDLSGHIVYAQHQELPNAEEILWEALVGHTGKKTLLKPIPRNPLAIVMVTVIILAIAGFFAYKQFVLEPELKRKRQAAALAADTTPIYIANLRRALSSVGWARGDMSMALVGLDVFPMYGKGWVLERRSCTSEPSQCGTQWKRTGGQLSDLTALFPNAVYDVAESSLDAAKLKHQQAVVPASMELESLMPVDAAAKQLREILQKLANAEAVITTGTSERWPPMDYKGVNPAAIASRSSVEISAPYPQIAAIIAELPPSVVLDKYDLTVSIGDVGNIFRVTVKGYIYAK